MKSLLDGRLSEYLYISLLSYGIDSVVVTSQGLPPGHWLRISPVPELSIGCLAFDTATTYFLTLWEKMEMEEQTDVGDGEKMNKG